MKVKCKHCGEVIGRDSAFKSGLSYFCDSNHAWRHSLTANTPKHREQDVDLREAVFAADGRRCRFCGTTRALHQHHVLYRSEGGPDTKANLITLCQAHHEVVHSDKRRFQPLLLRLLELRETNNDKSTKVLDLE